MFGLYAFDNQLFTLVRFCTWNPLAGNHPCGRRTVFDTGKPRPMITNSTVIYKRLYSVYC